MKILLAVDGSPYSKKMLAYMVTHPEVFSTSNEYTVLTVRHPLPMNASAALGSAAVKAYQVEESEKVISPICKFLARHGIEAKSAWKVGQPGAVISSFSDAGKFDMLIMGSHGHGAFVGLVMGSVATQVLARCKTPVLLVRG